MIKPDKDQRNPLSKIGGNDSWLPWILQNQILANRD